MGLGRRVRGDRAGVGTGGAWRAEPAPARHAAGWRRDRARQRDGAGATWRRQRRAIGPEGWRPPARRRPGLLLALLKLKHAIGESEQGLGEHDLLGMRQANRVSEAVEPFLGGASVFMVEREISHGESLSVVGC